MTSAAVSDNDSTNTGAIAGGVIGGVVGVALIGKFFFFYHLHKEAWETNKFVICL